MRERDVPKIVIFPTWILQKVRRLLHGKFPHGWKPGGKCGIPPGKWAQMLDFWTLSTEFSTIKCVSFLLLVNKSAMKTCWIFLVKIYSTDFFRFSDRKTVLLVLFFDYQLYNFRNPHNINGTFNIVFIFLVKNISIRFLIKLAIFNDFNRVFNNINGLFNHYTLCFSSINTVWLINWE